jgi:hypothetical protein
MRPRSKWSILMMSGFLAMIMLLLISRLATGESINEVHKKALKEGGTLNFYGTLPANPKVEPRDKIRPKVFYAIGSDDIKKFSKYQKIWNDIFKLR